MLDFKKKSRQNRDLIMKKPEKTVIKKIINKKKGNKTIIIIFKRYKSR